MSARVKSVSLARRLVGHYLVFGLLCLLLCLATTLVLSLGGHLEWLVPLSACVPFVVLAVGAFVVIQSVRLNSLVESQLQRISDLSPTDDLAVRQLPGSDPVAAGWNTLIDRLTSHDTWTRLEDRLASAVGNVQHDRVERVFQHLPVATAVTDAAGQIALANDAFKSLVGEPTDADLSGQGLLDLIGANRAANQEEISDKLSGYQGQVTFDIRRGENTPAGVLRVSRSPLAADGLEPAQNVWVVRDVTQQLLAEQMRNEFVFTATHELRTPLGNIKSYAELLELEQGIDVEKQKEFCNIINSEATRLSRFVDELLNISQMEAGALALNRHETNFEQLVIDVVQHVRPEMEKKQIDLQTKYPAKWPKLELDKDKMESALVNLLGNAAKYTPNGGRVALEVNVGENQISVQVEDTGIGIAEEELPHIFEKFFRSDDDRVRAVPGNGLGLAFTHDVARLHGGRLSVASELGKGSRFTLTLPQS